MMLLASCRCGQVALEATGAPIVSSVCYCASCQEGGRRLAESSSAPAVVGPDGGTEYVLFRKDRVRFIRGAERLEEQRLKPESPTRRVRATCCNSAMFLDMTKGHWLSFYRKRFSEGAPPIEMRVMTKERPAGVELTEDVPSYAGHSGKFMWRLIGARFAMGFRPRSFTY
ncbi:hypothetical protein AKJ09_01962 [Labilithrix luteola]|uniref:CENP-V/GFA domain-containing protein n=1 Tax=Labilithrix luteola TaxID=1391654 RepID=A0A0K1PP53_9BACT|nr:hypothetical protein [Labilithrix luteola]AKU95298.1 hypothetical protein AKJ09_01962 [Labilithrix luteola]